MPGPYIPAGDLQFGVDPIEAFHFAKWALGQYGVVGIEKTTPNATTLTDVATNGDTTIEVAAQTGYQANDYVQVGLGVFGDTVKITALGTGQSPYTWTVTPLLNSHASGVAVKPVQAPFTHMFQPTDAKTLPSFTARIGKEVFEHVFSGAAVDRLSFNVERGFLTATASILAQKDSRAALHTGSKTFPTDMYSARNGRTIIAGTNVSSLSEGFSLDIANNLDGEGGVRMGSRFLQELLVQGVDVSGTLTLAFADSNEYARFWGGASEPQESGADTFVLEQWFTSGSNGAKFIIGAAYWTQVATPVNGRGRITQDVQFKSVDDRIWDVVHIEATNSKERY